MSAATDRQTAFPYKLPKTYGIKLKGTTTRLKFRKENSESFPVPVETRGHQLKIENQLHGKESRGEVVSRGVY